MSFFPIIVAALEANNCTAVNTEAVDDKLVTPVQYVVLYRGCCCMVVPNEVVVLRPISLTISGTPRMSLRTLVSFDARGYASLTDAVNAFNARYARVCNLEYNADKDPIPNGMGFINALVELRHLPQQVAIEKMRQAAVSELTDRLNEINSFNGEPSDLKCLIAELTYSVNNSK